MFPTILTAKFCAWLAGVLLVCTLALGGFTYVNHLRNALASARVSAALSHADAITTASQSAATIAAATIADRGAQRDALVVTLHEDHQHAIEAASGAAAPVDPALNAAGRNGLCGYDAYAGDPGCAGLRQGHPAQLPATRSPDAPAGGQR